MVCPKGWRGWWKVKGARHWELHSSLRQGCPGREWREDHERDEEEERISKRVLFSFVGFFLFLALIWENLEYRPVWILKAVRFQSYYSLYSMLKLVWVQPTGGQLWRGKGRIRPCTMWQVQVSSQPSWRRWGPCWLVAHYCDEDVDIWGPSFVDFC